MCAKEFEIYSIDKYEHVKPVGQRSHTNRAAPIRGCRM